MFCMFPRRTHEISRLEALSDAVFTFALNPLVVSLQVAKSYAKLMNLQAFETHLQPQSAPAPAAQP